MVEMDDVVLQQLGGRHEVADQLAIFRHLHVKGVFHRAHRSQPVHQRANPADALGERPGVPRVAPAQYDLDAADLGAGAQRLDHISRRVNLDLDAQMPLDPSDRIDDDTLVRHG